MRRPIRTERQRPIRTRRVVRIVRSASPQTAPRTVRATERGAPFAPRSRATSLRLGDAGAKVSPGEAGNK